MRVAISNIAWEPAEESDAAAMLRECGCAGVEVAPTKVWPEPLAAAAADVLAYRRFWESRGIRIVALQALLFGRPDLTIFDDAATRAETGRYLRDIVALADALGAQALVFGSPKNRLRRALTMDEAMRIAVPFFREIGAAAAARGIAFCIEPNPTQYGCDFVVTAGEGLALTETVDSPGFGLHLDTAAMHLAGDAMASAVVAAMPRLRHFHVSAPFLAPVAAGGPIDYAEAAALLGRHRYDGVVSVEMKAGGGDNLAAAAAALDLVQGLFQST